MSDIDIEIDGKPLKAKPNTMVIQVADEAGIYIPRFCYHKHLSVAANCRMCLVEMEKSPKTVPACATPVMPGMKIFTRSPKALAAQKAVMEFLLINHPLDCPICDQGGECELQDLSMGYGAANSYFTYGKRAVADKDVGPLIETEMTRCIQCTRCVRFGTEMAGLRELGATGRGEHMEIGTYVEQAIRSEVSGNIIDLCPVGALTSKPFRFTARAWELNQFPSIAPHDCLGANINVHTRTGTVMRVVPRENKDLNETWIADRERYSYLGLYHPDRVTQPLIRIHDQWQETDWQTALEYAAKGLQRVKNDSGANQLGALISPNATTEEFFLLQKLWRQLGSSHVDHRLRQVDFSDQNSFSLFPKLEGSVVDLENYSTFLLIGSHLQKEQPLAALRVRKATLKGASVFAVNMMDYPFHFDVASKKVIAPHEFVFALAGIAKALLPEQIELAGVTATEQDKLIAERLRGSGKTVILLGALALNHPQASLIRWLAHKIARASQGAFGIFTEGGNAAGAWLAGAVPHRAAAGEKLQQTGLDAQAMLSQARQGYVLLNVEPEWDCANPVAAIQALAQAKFIVSLSVFKSAALEKYAHVILPIAPFTETAGTFVNVTGQWQSFRGVANAYGESRPAWKVLRVLGNLLHLQGFDYSSAEEVLQELKVLLQQVPAVEKEAVGAVIKKNEDILSRVGEIPIYAVDSLVRRAEALQAAQAVTEGELAVARIHPQTAVTLGLKSLQLVRVQQQNSEIQLPIVCDAKVPVNAVFIPGAIPVATGLSTLLGSVKITAVV